MVSCSQVFFDRTGGILNRHIPTAEVDHATAVSNVPWVAITSEASGTASATIQFAVQANGTGAPRSGTLTIGGQTFTISQE